MEITNRALLIMAIVIIIATIGASIVYISSEKTLSEKKYSVIVSGHPNWFPTMGLAKDGTMSGAAFDAAEGVCKDLGLDYKPMYAGSWSEVQRKLMGGEIDLVVAMYWTEDRQKNFVLSEPFTIDRITPFVPQGKTFPLKKIYAEKKGL